MQRKPEKLRNRNRLELQIKSLFQRRKRRLEPQRNYVSQPHSILLLTPMKMEKSRLLNLNSFSYSLGGEIHLKLLMSLKNQQVERRRLDLQRNRRRKLKKKPTKQRSRTKIDLQKKPFL